MKNAYEVVQKDLEYICSQLQAEFTLFEGKRVLITGGAGFLGYYFVQSLVHWNKFVTNREPIRLTVYDNLKRGLPNWLRDLQTEKKLNFVEYDVTDPLPEDSEDFHYIIHGATIASPTYYRKFPIETMDANVNGLRTLLDHARDQMSGDHPIEGFLFLSSSEIYGDPPPEYIPTPETYKGNVSCTGPRACYDESKRYGETLSVNFAEAYGIPIKIARPFNNYGPGLKLTDRRALPDFARDVLQGRDVVMFSDGSPTRTFCYVADAIVGYMKVLTKGQIGEAYNIGVPEPEISIAELGRRVVSLARELIDYKGNLVEGESSDRNYLVDNPNRRCPDINKASKELGYQPVITLDDGLRRSLIWYIDNQGAEEG